MGGISSVLSLLETRPSFGQTHALASASESTAGSQEDKPSPTASQGGHSYLPLKNLALLGPVHFCAQEKWEGRFWVLFCLFKLIKAWAQPFGDSTVCIFSSQGWKPRRNVVYKDNREPSTGESFKGYIIHPYSYLGQLLSGVYETPPPSHPQ